MQIAKRLLQIDTERLLLLHPRRGRDLVGEIQKGGNQTEQNDDGSVESRGRRRSASGAE